MFVRSVTFSLLLLAGAITLHGQQPPASGPGSGLAPDASGQEIYRAACITCHGAEGTGSPRELVGFSQELPDFTDCSFACTELLLKGCRKGAAHPAHIFGIQSIEWTSPGAGILNIETFARFNLWANFANVVPRRLSVRIGNYRSNWCVSNGHDIPRPRRRVLWFFCCHLCGRMVSGAYTLNLEWNCCKFFATSLRQIHLTSEKYQRSFNDAQEGVNSP